MCDVSWVSQSYAPDTPAMTRVRTSFWIVRVLQSANGTRNREWVSGDRSGCIRRWKWMVCSVVALQTGSRAPPRQLYV